MKRAKKKKQVEQSDPRIPSKESSFFDGMRGLDCSMEKVGIEKALFQQY